MYSRKKKVVIFLTLLVVLSGSSFFVYYKFHNRQKDGQLDLVNEIKIANEKQPVNFERTFSNAPIIDPHSLARFVDPLPVPKALIPNKSLANEDYYEISMEEFKQKMHRDLPETTVWGYNGATPGPIIEARSDRPVKVKWINNLPPKHLLPVDKTIEGIKDKPEVRTVVHLHGGHVPAQSDGWPEDWFTSGSSVTYDYPNNQRPGTLWFHDHALGITRLNVYAGLAGLYILRNQTEDNLNLPKGDYEIPLVIQDKTFREDGSLYYSDGGELKGLINSQGMNTMSNNSGDDFPSPSIEPEFFGEVNLVNGKVWPFLSVEPRKYRFRVVNGSNSRFYNLKLSNYQSFEQIGTEGGFLEKPVLKNNLLIGPGERADLILDFSKDQGKSIVLTNDAETPYNPKEKKLSKNDPASVVMQFIVNKALNGTDSSVVPNKLSTVEWIDTKKISTERTIGLTEETDEYGRLLMMLNKKMWSDPVTENPKIGTNEIWNFANTTPDSHPFHLHLVMFQVLERRPFNVEFYKKTGNIRYTGSAKKPNPNEIGWKDTVQTNPGEITKVAIRFDDYKGKFLYHCHILEHEEYMMMRPFEVQ